MTVVIVLLALCLARLLELEGVEPVGLSLAVWRRVGEVSSDSTKTNKYKGLVWNDKELGACEVGIRDLGSLFWDFEISNVFQKRRR